MYYHHSAISIIDYNYCHTIIGHFECFECTSDIRRNISVNRRFGSVVVFLMEQFMQLITHVISPVIMWPLLWYLPPNCALQQWSEQKYCGNAVNPVVVNVVINFRPIQSDVRRWIRFSDSFAPVDRVDSDLAIDCQQQTR